MLNSDIFSETYLQIHLLRVLFPSLSFLMLPSEFDTLSRDKPNLSAIWAKFRDSWDHSSQNSYE